MDAKTAARIEALKHSQGWDDLIAEFERQEEKYWKLHIAAVKRGQIPSPTELAHDMGKLDGIRAILSAPEKAARILLRVDEQENSK